MKGKDGKFCLAKTVYTIASLAFVAKIFLADMTITKTDGTLIEFAAVDYTGLSLILGVFASTYWGRSVTKANTTDMQTL